MVKKILQDVIPPGRRSIRHIPLPENRKSNEQTNLDVADMHPKHRTKIRFTRWVIIVGSLLLLGAVLVAASMTFSSATVVIKPKQATAVVDVSIPLGITSASGVSGVVVTATSSASQVIAATKEQDVQRKASGQIVIYNNYSSESQRLIKNTRFQSPDGRIYRIDTSVVVPGQTIENGKKVAGNLTVTAYADSAGTEYNLSLASLKGDFTIPGFKGTPRYQSFYARLKTDITGGFSGRARVADEQTVISATNDLKTKLNEDLWKTLQSSLPSGFTLSKNLYQAEYQVSSTNDTSGQGITLSVTAVGRAVIFDTKLLSSAVAEQSLPSYENEDIRIQNLSDLDITPHTQDTNFWESDSLVLGVKGNAHFVWQFDEQKIITALVGIPKNQTDSIMRTHPAIAQAEVTIKPSWLTKYPSREKKIHITVKLD
ncbi:MAG: hypothetical protein A3C06_00455 [Candidatus Taylorbacteria bacterium RIFCSPHIGHO2_02_FULL_46_13]|uniref:Baseplate protein J-like domain-containing protein n=1 Tax=Candidatus Taylorbacteria bacterium RIFCSPHIGHO2_02_FULL_46_13 TaxID=1802312 RepID=A0A1G2MVH2_9BACT|nr:MAG: hypothetical protein A3C06_00455 [Candidatus Taylorbacteria bacterium RIFCSPHIGHO2_02_FULL_46_13]